MLPEETQEQLSKYGFDVSALTNALRSEEVVNVDVPQLYTEKGFTQDELTVFGKNRFDEGKTAMSEILAKSFKTQYELDVEGKDINKVFEAYGEKKFNEAKPSDDNKELLNNFKSLQAKYSELEQEKEGLKQDFESKLFKTNIKSTLTSHIPKEVSLATDKVINLYMMDHDLKNHDGSTVVAKDGEVIKDKLLNPVPIADHFKSWIDESGLMKKQGMGGKDNNSGSTVTKFKNMNEFMDYAKKNSIEPMSSEGMSFLSENKADDFAY